MNDKITNTASRVRLTTNYGIFKTLDGNRVIAKARAKKIKHSILEHGYIHNPIIVNEKMEVVDGQGRLEALKELGMPVEFVMFEGLTIADCIALNVYQTSWDLMDYIDSHAERGKQSYSFLRTLIKKHKALGVSVCVCACTGTISESGVRSKVRNGEFECSGEQYEKADELLSYVTRFFRTIKTFKKGANNYICHALMFAYQLKGVDREKLVDKFNKYYGMDNIPKFIDARGALQNLTHVYNTKNKDKIWFEVEYEKALTKKYTWYAKRHSSEASNQ